MTHLQLGSCTVAVDVFSCVQCWNQTRPILSLKNGSVTTSDLASPLLWHRCKEEGDRQPIKVLRYCCWFCHSRTHLVGLECIWTILNPYKPVNSFKYDMRHLWRQWQDPIMVSSGFESFMLKMLCAYWQSWNHSVSIDLDMIQLQRLI